MHAVVEVANAAAAVGGAAEEHAVLFNVTCVRFCFRPQHNACHVFELIGNGIVGPADISLPHVAIEERCHTGYAAQRFSGADEERIAGHFYSECRYFAQCLFLRAVVEHDAWHREFHGFIGEQLYSRMARAAGDSFRCAEYQGVVRMLDMAAHALLGKGGSHGNHMAFLSSPGGRVSGAASHSVQIQAEQRERGFGRAYTLWSAQRIGGVPHGTLTVFAYLLLSLGCLAVKFY